MMLGDRTDRIIVRVMWIVAAISVVLFVLGVITLDPFAK